MIFNKSYLTTFSKNKPFLALASKGKIIDSKFTLSSELSLYDYSMDVHYSPLQTDSEYCKLEWCEKDDMQILACGHTNGSIALYEPSATSNGTQSSDSFKLIKNFEGLTGKVLGIDYNQSKNVIAAGSAKGNIIFWNLDKIDQQYKCDIPITENITSLAWNTKVSRILCAGTECGKILVLDIRAKNIAMTLQNKDIKTINNVRWNPKCSTSIFASTNIPSLACFKLDSNSLTQIGNFNSSTISFNNLNDDTVVCYSDNKIEYIDVDSLTVKESLNVENVFDISFSQKDPIYCCSYNSGTTEVFTKILSSIVKGNPHVQLNNYIVNKNIQKIRDHKIEIHASESAESKLLDILYGEKVFKFDDETRKTLAKIFLENGEIFKTIKPGVENEGIKFNLTDNVIKYLIRRDFVGQDSEKFEDRTVSLKFILDLLVNKKKVDTSDPLNFLISLAVENDFGAFWKKISSEQWTVMVSILMYSDLPNEKVLEIIKEILTELQIPILNLLINEPRNYFNTRESTPDLPKSVFEIIPFFEKYGSEIINLKKLNLKYDNPLINEYFWYAKNHGIYNELKDIGFEDQVIKTYIGCTKQNENQVVSPVKNIEKDLNKMTIEASVSKPIPEVMTRVEQPKPSILPQPNRPSLYSGTANKSVTSFSTKPIPKIGSTEYTTPSFSTKPAPPKRTLYSGVLNRSSTSFSTRPESSVSTYGQQNGTQVTPSQIPSPYTSNAPKSPAIPILSKMKSPTIPQPMTRSTPVPNNTQISDQDLRSNYDPVLIAKSFEESFEALKQAASKKNNLIVGNKIKDAVRRFAVFQQLNKSELSPALLERMDHLLNIINNETDRNQVKNKVRSLVDECNDIKSCQSDIWLPAMAILVQLVY